MLFLDGGMVNPPFPSGLPLFQELITISLYLPPSFSKSTCFRHIVAYFPFSGKNILHALLNGSGELVGNVDLCVPD